MTLNPRAAFVAAAVLAAASFTACAGQTSPGVPNVSRSTAFDVGRDAGARVPGFKSSEFFNEITPNSNPRGITVGPGGVMWFTQIGSDQIARITAQGSVTEFSGPAQGVNNIVRGSDGNLWFTTGADAIGRITPRGKVTVFSTGNEAYGPFDIVNGPDGNLWFTFRSPSTNAIGKITTKGVVSLFTYGLSAGDVAVHDITSGPDGRIWFTEEFGNRIGAITTNGTITEYSSGISTGAGLVDITSGPDGNLWFTENSINQIGRITPSGAVTEFSQGISPNAGPGSIAQSRGSIWFAENGYANIGQVTPSGAITEHPIAIAGTASDIARAESGDLWLTDFTGNGIVKVVP